MGSRKMSEIRKQRLLALTTVVAGVSATALVVANPGVFEGSDGSLMFPIFAIVGAVALVVLRPRRNR